MAHEIERIDHAKSLAWCTGMFIFFPHERYLYAVPEQQFHKICLQYKRKKNVANKNYRLCKITTEDINHITKCEILCSRYYLSMWHKTSDRKFCRWIKMKTLTDKVDYMHTGVL